MLAKGQPCRAFQGIVVNPTKAIHFYTNMSAKMEATGFSQKDCAGHTLTCERRLTARFGSLEFKVDDEGDFRAGLPPFWQPCPLLPHPLSTYQSVIPEARPDHAVPVLEASAYESIHMPCLACLDPQLYPHLYLFSLCPHTVALLVPHAPGLLLLQHPQ